MSINFASDNLQGVITAVSVDKYEVKGTVLLGGANGDAVLQYQAAGAPDTHLGRSACGLPFPNEEVAYSGGENCGQIALKDNRSFRFLLQQPNFYYTCGGRQLVPPCIKFTILEPSSGSSSTPLYVVVGPTSTPRSLTSLPGRPIRSTGR